jgi:hypothetical protein
MVVELIREFYTEQRKFRITGENENSYISYSNNGLSPQEIKSPTQSGEKMYRKAIFDIKVEPQRKSPFNISKHNDMILSLFKEGAFDKEKKEQTIIALKSMVLDSKESLIKIIEEN